MQMDDPDEIEKECNTSSFLRWNDGPFVLQFRRGPDFRKVHFTQDGGAPQACEGPSCKLCASGNEMRRSFLYEVFCASDVSGPCPKEAALDLSPNAQKFLTPIQKDLRTEHGMKLEGDVVAWQAAFFSSWFKCEKRGSGRATSYSYIKVPKPEGIEQEEIPF